MRDGSGDAGGVEGDVRDRQRGARFVDVFGGEGGVRLGAVFEGEPVRPVAVEGAEADLVGRIRFEFDEFVGEGCFPARAENAVAGFRTGAPFRVFVNGFAGKGVFEAVERGVVFAVVRFAFGRGGDFGRGVTEFVNRDGRYDRRAIGSGGRAREGRGWRSGRDRRGGGSGRPGGSRAFLKRAAPYRSEFWLLRSTKRPPQLRFPAARCFRCPSQGFPAKGFEWVQFPAGASRTCSREQSSRSAPSCQEGYLLGADLYRSAKAAVGDRAPVTRSATASSPRRSRLRCGWPPRARGRA